MKPVSALEVAKEDNVARRLSERVAKLIVRQDEGDEITSTPQIPASSIPSLKVFLNNNKRVVKRV